MQKGGDCLIRHAGVHTTGLAMVVSDASTAQLVLTLIIKILTRLKCDVFATPTT